MRIEFGRPARALSHLSRRRLTDEANNRNISVFFQILFRGLACADSSRPSFGCNEANERLTHLHLSSLFPLLTVIFLFRRRCRPPCRQLCALSPEHRLSQVWPRPTLNARLGL